MAAKRSQKLWKKPARKPKTRAAHNHQARRLLALEQLRQLDALNRRKR
jgi:hypothetical protein